MDPTLTKERNRSPNPLEGLSLFWAGSAEHRSRRNYLTSLWFNDPVIRNAPKLYVSFLPRTAQYTRGLRLMARLQELKLLHNLSSEDVQILKEIHGEDVPLTVHDTVYAPAVAGQADSKQSAQLTETAKAWAHIGCYAQTELAHGSNVRGIETTATYHPSTDTFILHTPTPTATKWWVGGLGKTATYAIVVARLILPSEAKYQDYGPHPFHMQIRDLLTLKPLDGIEIGDIGPKVGFVPVDNGYMRFNNVKIPRSSLLGKFSRVEVDERTKSIKYIPPVHPQAAYGSMMSARALIVRSEYLTLAIGVTIAVRYSAVRRQFGKENTTASTTVSTESQVLDYSTQQLRLFPLISQVYALRAVSEWLMTEFAKANTLFSSGNLTTLTDMHILSSSLKVYITENVSSGLETARRCLGGHGYSQASGIPRLAAAQVHLVTAEGDNWILSQQVARYILKLKNTASKANGTVTEPFSSTSYLSAPISASTFHCIASDPSVWYRNEYQLVLDILGFCVTAIAEKMEEKLLESSISGNKEASTKAWDSCLMDSWYVTHLHGARTVLAIFIQTLKKMTVHSSLFHQQKQLLSTDDKQATIDLLFLFLHLYIMNTLRTFMPIILEYELIPSPVSTFVRSIDTELLRLCRAIRPYAVIAVDAFEFHDGALGSALGTYNGDVYTLLLEWVKAEPLNQQEASPAIKEIHRIMELGSIAVHRTNSTDSHHDRTRSVLGSKF